MHIYNTLNPVNIGPSACAIGMFDGVHVGHRMVLEQALRDAKIQGLQSVVFTFANHPQSVISRTPTPLLSSTAERLETFEQMGFDAVLLLAFTPELRDLSAEDFVQHILVDTLKVKAVSIGYDHRFGRGRQGDGPFLKSEGERYGFKVTIVEPIRADQQIVSSTLIRKLLSYGDLEKANHLLGKPYQLTGRVISGVGRGRTIGFPTANLEIAPDRLIPAQGVYAGMVRIEGDPGEHHAVCNIGLAPTFGDQHHLRMEVHLLDYDADLYGKAVTFVFHHHLRTEQTFPTVDALIAQLTEDCQEARLRLLKEP